MSHVTSNQDYLALPRSSMGEPFIEPFLINVRSVVAQLPLSSAPPGPSASARFLSGKRDSGRRGHTYYGDEHETAEQVLKDCQVRVVVTVIQENFIARKIRHDMEQARAGRKGTEGLGDSDDEYEEEEEEEGEEEQRLSLLDRMLQHWDIEHVFQTCTADTAARYSSSAKRSSSNPSTGSQAAEAVAPQEEAQAGVQHMHCDWSSDGELVVLGARANSILMITVLGTSKNPGGRRVALGQLAVPVSELINHIPRRTKPKRVKIVERLEPLKVPLRHDGPREPEYTVPLSDKEYVQRVCATVIVTSRNLPDPSVPLPALALFDENRFLQQEDWQEEEEEEEEALPHTDMIEVMDKENLKRELLKAGLDTLGSEKQLRHRLEDHVAACLAYRLSSANSTVIPRGGDDNPGTVTDATGRNVLRRWPSFVFASEGEGVDLSILPEEPRLVAVVRDTLYCLDFDRQTEPYAFLESPPPALPLMTRGVSRRSSSVDRPAAMLNHNVILPLTLAAFHAKHSGRSQACEQPAPSLPLLQSVKDTHNAFRGLEAGGAGGQGSVNSHIQIMRRLPDLSSGTVPPLPLQIITLCWHPDTCPKDDDNDDDADNDDDNDALDLAQVHQHWLSYLQALTDKGGE